MKRSLAKYFACFQGIDVNKKSPAKVVNESFDDSELAKVLREIFSVDPETGQPKVIFQYWMSSKVIHR